MGNYDHAKYKKDFFHRFKPSMISKENPGFGSEWHCVATKSCLAFVDIYERFRLDDKNKRAELIAPLLDEVGWAWLYGDDGSLRFSDNSAIIHTEYLDGNGAKFIADSLSKFIGIDNCASVCIIS